MYITTTPLILIFMGYKNEIDFSVQDNSVSIDLNWYNTDPKPTEQDILDNEQPWMDSTRQQSMIANGKEMTLNDDSRISVGASALVEDRNTHDTWMQTLYQNVDSGTVSLPKPPSGERQAYSIDLEDRDPFTFTRYQDQWGWRWRMDLIKDDVTSLALYIKDSNGGYLYTTGALLDNGQGGWYTECPAGQADQNPENVYFNWILGSSSISRDFVYEGTEETLEGEVRYDTDYDE